MGRIMDVQVNGAWWPLPGKHRGLTVMESIDIKQIMQEIREEALTRIPVPERLPETLDLFAGLAGTTPGFDRAEYGTILMLLNRHWQVQLDRPLIQSGGIKGRLKRIYHKVSRRLMRWYIAPVIQDINENNARSLQLHNQISCFIDSQQIEIERLKAALAEVQRQCAERDAAVLPTGKVQ